MNIADDILLYYQMKFLIFKVPLGRGKLQYQKNFMII